MIASLPMYDRPETQAANDRLWNLVREGYMGRTPEALTRDDDLWGQWLSPDLVLSQTCGMPYRTSLHGKVALVGTPHLDIDCGPGLYYSVFVARKAETRSTLADYHGARFAFNERGSQSGWAAPQVAAQDLGFSFTDLLETGSHSGSARAVAYGRADIAAIDALTWQMIRRLDNWAATLAEVGRTLPTPALPYITARKSDASELFAALAEAIDALSPIDRDKLGLQGLLAVPASAYLAVRDPEPLPG